jgi:hypothetical protein
MWEWHARGADPFAAATNSSPVVMMKSKTITGGLRRRRHSPIRFPSRGNSGQLGASAAFIAAIA